MNENNDYNNNNIGGSNKKKRKVGRQRKEKKDVSASTIARTKNLKLLTMYNNAEVEISRLKKENKDLKQRIKHLEPAFESEETIDNATLKRNAINDFIDSVKTLNEVMGGTDVLIYLCKEVGKLQLNIEYASRKKKSKENFAVVFLETILELLGIPDHFRPASFTSSSIAEGNRIEILNPNLLKFVDDLAVGGLYPYFSYLVHQRLQNDEKNSNYIKTNINELKTCLGKCFHLVWIGLNLLFYNIFCKINLKT